MANVVPREVPKQNPSGLRPRGFWPRDLRRHNIHHDTSKVFFVNVILIASRTSKEGFLSDWVWPMDSLGSPLDIIPGSNQQVHSGHL